MNSKYHQRIIFLSLFFLFIIFAKGQVNAQKIMENYASQWKKIETFQERGLPKSALEEVDKIYTQAKTDQNEPQVIKALLFKISFNENLAEDANSGNIALLEKESDLQKGAPKAILQSITAQLYWNYFQQNRYKLYSRTNTENIDKKDIATWTKDDLHQKIGELYSASIKDETLLKNTLLAAYEPIILKGNARQLRPTLYDLLAHRALDYFKNDERDITRPAYAFEINEDKAFGPAKEFIHTSFDTKDTTSLHYKALLIFQKLLAFHAKDKKPDALIDVDMERLSFVNQYGVMPEKTSLYIRALKSLGEEYPDNPVAAQATFQMAQTIYLEAIEPSGHKNDSVQFSLKNVKILLDDLVTRFPESRGGMNAYNLIITIERPELSLITEKVNVPGLPFRSLVKYKNVSNIYLRVIELTPQLKTYLRKNGENNKVFSKLIAEKNIRSWKQDLPDTDDYLSHSVEIKIDELPTGEYVLLGSTDGKFSFNNQPLAAQYIYVSNISYVNNNQQYFALNRTTGQPLEGAKVQVWNTEYDYKTRDYTLIKRESLVADKNGYFQLIEEDKKDQKPNRNRSQNVRLEISHQKDHLFLDDYEYVYAISYAESGEEYEDQKEFDEDNARVFLFTDRSIYRPGQVVYFKGIGVSRDWNTNKTILLKEKDSLTIYLHDANGQQIDSLKVILNEFGSFNGKFSLPENNLNGEFDLEVEKYPNSNASFSVEEYKRPKFYTELEKVKEGYRVNDTVTITGFAKAYAGNNITGSNVTYRITREARFIYPWRFWGKGFPSVQPLEIAHGELVTDADGQFSLQFKAIPDLTLDKNTDPVFDYKIEVDVTDLNGETRSAETIVSVGYKALNLQIGLARGQVINLDSLKSISITSKNLSGEVVPVKAKLAIYPLIAPDRLIRKRLWEKPDQFVLSKEEFIRYFPQDEYKDETNEETWERGGLLVEKTDTVSLNTSVTIPTSGFAQGWYVAEVTAQDKYGQEVKNVQYFQLYDKKSSKIPTQQYVWNLGENTVVQPGETARIITGTAAESVYMIQEINKKKTFDFPARTAPGSIKDFTFYNLNQDKRVIDFKTTEADRGGFGVYTFFVKDNRFYSVSNTIEMPWTNKDLSISFGTYRDKTLPGSEEKWTVKIIGEKGEKVAAEMLASMYDASLDQFKPHSWKPMLLFPTYSGYNNWQGRQNFTTINSFEKYRNEKYRQPEEKRYDVLNYLPLGYRLYASGGILRRNAAQKGELLIQSEAMMSKDMAVTPGLAVEESVAFTPPRVVMDSEIISEEEQKPTNEIIDQSTVQIRKNFNETAFFYPELKTDEEGNIQFSFTMPEALTEWKIMTLAHTKDLATGYAEKTIVTQKELMVQPNAPRFFREGDKMEFSAKIVNLGEKEVSGSAELHLLNASTMNPIDGWFKNITAPKSFSVEAGQSSLVIFPIEIPENFNEAVVYRLVAKAGEVSDGEEAAIPVVTNRMLVTESVPLPMRGEGSKQFTFEKLLQSGNSSTLTNYGLTVEFTTNPAWYAVQAMPYLMEYPYECSEQHFNRFYANALAMKIANSSPKIKAIFEQWREADTAALLSNLQKNEELKSVLLQETPWVLQAQNEAQQKKNIALLFDMVKMSGRLNASLDKVIQMQSPNGGFVWFEGGPDNRYITQYIVSGIGHLKQLEAYPPDVQNKLKSILDKAVSYLDKRLKEDYDNLVKRKVNLKNNQLSTIAIQYLYMRSFFPEYPVPAATQTALRYYRGQAQEFWLSQSKYMQGMIALSLHRTDDPKTAKSIIQSLKENALHHEEMGMYWKEWDRPGYWWYQAPIESQALMIEAFSEIDNDPGTIGDLKMWLLKNKQTTNWKTTKATAEAVYALLLQGTDWLSEERNVVIEIGKTTFNSKEEKQEAGTGYFKRRIAGHKVEPEMGNIKVSLQSENANASAASGGAWGSVYWQYFEDLDKITFAETPLKLSKKLFIEKNTDRGPVLTPINEGDNLHIGDKIKVRIELRVDRDMEFVHMKDMRASAMEPTNVLSQYKWQGGLGYYETTKDVSTNFFFQYLNKGTYVFEYPMFVTHTGNFSNGVTTIQCMYAPEFTAHSEGVRVNVVE